MIKVGIIGCGGIAFGKHLPSLAQIDTVEILAFCDLDKTLAQKAKIEYGTEDAKIFTDYRELLKLDLDVVHVLTPNNTHAEISIAAMESSKHVMCEKPMAINAKEAQSMIDAMEKTGKKLTIGYQNRFRDDSEFLYNQTKQDKLGHIYMAKAKAIRRRAVPTWGVFLDEEAQGGGPLIDIGTHALDLTLWMMNNYKPKMVVGNVYHELSKTENAANAWGAWDVDKFKVEDSAFAYITMENGASIFLEASWALNTTKEGEAKTELYGTKMGAEMDHGLMLNGEEDGVLFEKNINFEIGGVDFYDGSSVDIGYKEAKAWIDCIINDTDPLVSPYEAMVVTEILDAIYLSSKTKQAVIMKEDSI